MLTRAFVITITENPTSVAGAKRCIESIRHTNSDLQAEIFPAVTPDTIFDCHWSWPLKKKKICPHTNLTLTAYKNTDVRRRIACAQSHWLLWQLCVGLGHDICILEHDALFVGKFDTIEFEGGVLSLNDPANATFKPMEYNQALVDGINEIPWITDPSIPQGLPGNSAYLIKPWAAQQLIHKQNEIGWWPNDAIMCKQLFPWLRAFKPYLTVTQNIPSTTVH